MGVGAISRFDFCAREAEMFGLLSDYGRTFENPGLAVLSGRVGFAAWSVVAGIRHDRP
jgi:hypothetical protein